jgi:hypothetical protein
VSDRGAYLEELEGRTKPREKSPINEAFRMFQEIVFLKGVWERNRPLWLWSLTTTSYSPTR